MASWTRHQLGEYGVSMETMTYGDVPMAVPRDVTVTGECPSNLIVNWNQADPVLLYGPVEEAQYMVTYSRVGSGDGESVTVEWEEGQVRGWVLNSRCV